MDTSFNEKKINDAVTDTGIQKILLTHLRENGGDASVAFSPEGIERMNQNIRTLNDGKAHQPICKVRVYEKAEKYAVGQRGNKSSKFVEGAKSTNLYFAIYEETNVDPETGKTIRRRSYQTVPLRDVIKQLKQGLPPAPANEKGLAPTYVLSPGDLVYLPTAEEVESGIVHQPLNRERIYKMVSATGRECDFIRETVASPIVDKVEFSPKNKMERAITGEMIKETCIPLKVNRLGIITGFAKANDKKTNE